MKHEFSTKKDQSIYELLYNQLGEYGEILDALIDSMKKTTVDYTVERIAKRRVIKVGVYTDDLEKGKRVINELSSFSEVISVKTTVDQYEIYCHDVQYQIVKFNESSRGIKIDIAYVDNDLKNKNNYDETLNARVRNALMYSNHLYYFD